MNKKIASIIALLGLGVGGWLFHRYGPLNKPAEKKYCEPCLDYEYTDYGTIDTFDENCNLVRLSHSYGNHKNSIVEIGGKKFNPPRYVISVKKDGKKIDYYDMNKDDTLDAVVIEEPGEKREYIKFKVTEIRYIHARTSYLEKHRKKITPKGRKNYMHLEENLISDKKLRGKSLEVFRVHERKFKGYMEIFKHIRKEEIKERKRILNKKIKKYLKKDKK